MQVFANAELVLPEGVVRGALTVAHGRIVAIAAGASVPAGALDCGGDLLAPGLIELHTRQSGTPYRASPQGEIPP